jgi:hypothetical protein
MGCFASDDDDDARMEWYGLDSSDSGKGAMEDSCEHGNEPSGSIRSWKILE